MDRLLSCVTWMLQRVLPCPLVIHNDFVFAVVCQALLLLLIAAIHKIPHLLLVVVVRLKHFDDILHALYLSTLTIHFYASDLHYTFATKTGRIEVHAILAIGMTIKARSTEFNLFRLFFSCLLRSDLSPFNSSLFLLLFVSHVEY